MNALSRRQQAILQYLGDSPRSSTRHIQSALEGRFDAVSRASVSRDLAALYKAGHVRRLGRGRACHYSLEDRAGLRWVSGKDTADSVYITRVFNYGTWDEWQDMLARYSREDIAAVLYQPLRGSWTRRGRALAEAVYGITLPDNAILSYD